MTAAVSQIRKRISDLADDHELMSLELDDVVGLLDATCAATAPDSIR